MKRRKNKKNNKISKAVALSYKQNYNAPKVVAKGKGETANNIIQVAQDSNVEIYEDENLAENLLKLDLYEEIPPELYEAVSHVILYVYYLDKEKGEDIYDE